MKRLQFTVAMLALAACDAAATGTGDAAATDAAQVVADSGPADAAFCNHTHDCAPGWGCRQNECFDVCAGDPTGTPCNVHDVNDGRFFCCSQQQRCCYDGFESEGCYPADEPCPKFCSPSFGTCPADEYCHSWWPPFLPPMDGCFYDSCAADCPPEQRCGPDHCCGSGTHCDQKQLCCVADGVPDAGVPDAAPAP